MKDIVRQDKSLKNVDNLISLIKKEFENINFNMNLHLFYIFINKDHKNNTLEYNKEKSPFVVFLKNRYTMSN